MSAENPPDNKLIVLLAKQALAMRALELKALKASGVNLKVDDFIVETPGPFGKFIMIAASLLPPELAKGYSDWNHNYYYDKKPHFVKSYRQKFFDQMGFYSEDLKRASDEHERKP